MGRKKPRQYRKYPRYSNGMRRVNNLIYDASGVVIGIGVFGAIAGVSGSMWGR